MEAETGKEASQVGFLGLHIRNPIVWKLVSHPRVLATVEEVLGPDLLLLGSHFFCKQPGLADSYVSWHQDVTYWGLNPPMAVTLWLSIDGADVENGCMRVIPRSHLGGLLPHGKAQTKGNLLSVNQEIDLSLVDESHAVDIELPPGSASLHHGMTIHGSNPNRSTRRRCGLTMRFITPDGRAGRRRWRPLATRPDARRGPLRQFPPCSEAFLIEICNGLSAGRPAADRHHSWRRLYFGPSLAGVSRRRFQGGAPRSLPSPAAR